MNVTIKLEDALCKEARHRAVDRGLSLSGWVAELLQKELAGEPHATAGLLESLSMEDHADREFEIAKKGRAVAVTISIGEYEAMIKRLAEMEKPGDFSWLREWRKNAAKDRESGTTDLSDYHQHLDRKYGA